MQNDCLSEEAEKYINYVAEHSVPKAMTLNEIDSESSKDEMFGNIRQCTKTNKWPAHDKTVTPYFKICAELSLHGNLLLRGSKTGNTL